MGDRQFSLAEQLSTELRVHDKNSKIFTLEMFSCENGEIVANRQLKDFVYTMAINPLKTN